MAFMQTSAEFGLRQFARTRDSTNPRKEAQGCSAYSCGFHEVRHKSILTPISLTLLWAAPAIRSNQAIHKE